jgi:ankyrin repeat protein
MLLEHGADVNTKDDFGITPLHWAADKGHVEVVKLLLERGADPNAKSNYSWTSGWTPLHYAADKGHIEVVEALLKHGADVNAKDKDGKTPLHVASVRGDVNIVKLLLERGADPNARDGNGETPLHWAASKGHVEVVEVLLEYGADINIKDRDGRTPLHVASAAYRAPEWDYVDAIELLLEHGADPNARDGNGETPLHKASASGNVEVVEVLLKHGADVNAKDNYGNTPLHKASVSYHIGVAEVLKVLLEHGADLNAENKYGCTPLDSARHDYVHMLVEWAYRHNKTQRLENTELKEVGSISIKWAKLYRDFAPSGMCIGGDYIYIVEPWRIEKRNKYDGKLVKTKKVKYSYLDDCVVVRDKLYVAGVKSYGEDDYSMGLWSFDLDLNLLKVESRLVPDLHNAVIASDGQYLYVATWVAEKRRLDDLSLVAETTYGGRPFSISINPVTGHLWVAAVEVESLVDVNGSLDIHRKCVIKVLDRDLNHLTDLEPEIVRECRGVVFDEVGNAYVYGFGGVVKYSRDGVELARAIGFNGVGAAYMGGRLYLVTASRLIVLDADLKKIGKLDLWEISRHVNAAGTVAVYRAVFDGSIVYIVGKTRPRGTSKEEKWLVFAISLPYL